MLLPLGTWKHLGPEKGDLGCISLRHLEDFQILSLKDQISLSLRLVRSWDKQWPALLRTILQEIARKYPHLRMFQKNLPLSSKERLKDYCPSENSK
jgi:hypothetical protein